MGRKCTCGCTKFDATIVQHIEVEGLVDFADSEDGEITKIGDEEEVCLQHDEGPYLCVQCGQEYERYDDIPTDEEYEEMKEDA